MMTKEDEMLIQQVLQNQKEDRDHRLRMEGKIDRTFEQALKTNGRVTKLEEVQKTCPVKMIQKETEVVRFFNNHPNLLKWTAIGLVLISIASVAASALTIQKTSEMMKSAPVSIELKK